MTEPQWTKLLVLAASLLGFAGCADDGTSGRGSEIINCTTGATVTVACGAEDIGSCEGDPVLAVCDGSLVDESDCGESGFDRLGRNDDFDYPVNLCPALDVVCPESGLLSVSPTAFTGSMVCFWEAVE